MAEVDLLALVLQTGNRGASAVELARTLKLRYPTLAELAAASAAELANVAGIGPCRAAAICAALELGRRADHAALPCGQPVRGSQAVFHHFHARLGALRQERFYVVMLDGKGRLLREVRVSEGSLTASIVHPREVFRAAIRESAAAVLLVHNHPSGDPTPSREDLRLTRQLVECADLLDLRIHDHVIVGHERFISLAQRGALAGPGRAS